jgi:AcrR family transcriptional regulator
MEPTRVVPNARQRVRVAVTADIVAEARRQLAEVGAGALSLRAVARELGMASSAMYRYFTSRDELLTALIVEAYDALGGVAEAAAAATTDDKAFIRWQTVCRAIRGWAFEHPYEYVLLYGSPVPGYQAPEVTLVPASRATLVLAGLVLDAHRSGELEEPDGPPLPRAVASEIRPIAQIAMPGVPLSTATQGILVWTQLFGQISFEIFGRFDGIVANPQVLFEHAVVAMARQLGMRPTRASRA